MRGNETPNTRVVGNVSPSRRVWRFRLARELAGEKCTSPSFNAASLEGDVSRYAVEPTAESASPFELVESLVHSHQHELRHVLGFIVVGDETPSPLAYTIAYPASELLECRGVSAAHSHNELGQLVIVAWGCDRDLHRMHDSEMGRQCGRVYTDEPFGL
jgi:hypothetical protein